MNWDSSAWKQRATPGQGGKALCGSFPYRRRTALEDGAYAKYITEYASAKNVEISALAYYPNTMDPDLQKREAVIEHLKNVIRPAGDWGSGW